MPSNYLVKLKKWIKKNFLIFLKITSKESMERMKKSKALIEERELKNEFGIGMSIKFI